MTLKIIITSDPICPMCYVGFLQLQSSLQILGVSESDYTIEFAPFLLRPDLAEERAVSRKMLRDRKNGEELSRQLYEEVNAEVERYGIRFTEDGPVRSSMLSHRLLEEAYARGGPNLQLPFALALFRSYHEQGQDNGLPSLLIPLAIENHLFPDVEAAQAWVNSTERVEEVEKRIFQARNKKGIQGVPYTELEYDGRLVVVRGALEPTEILAKLMGIKTAEEGEHAGGAREGVACL
ncbi:thioredoxin-like protein [Microstroma glucosiphilum]|uniref:Thioredoxin-like protein n=1 Tax=Pseudomicrostroma glucosiphilum TaxID=1684307 RepID=A0A316U410_9BASI|nr:thioredoxin-like protein [Pseudomicrostroma glucosiphilum]PWN19538.1 thioredoxin-like protein [Pseudomicrostroma glucosiphilum]